MAMYLNNLSKCAVWRVKLGLDWDAWSSAWWEMFGFDQLQICSDPLPQAASEMSATRHCDNSRLQSLSIGSLMDCLETGWIYQPPQKSNNNPSVEQLNVIESGDTWFSASDSAAHM